MLIKRKQRGFSLIELMVAVVIVGLLIAFAAPNFSTWIQNQQIRTAAESILNGLQMTRSAAVSSNGNARFVLCGLPASSWEVRAVSATAAANAIASPVCGTTVPAGEVRVQERSGQEGSRNAQVLTTSINPPPTTIPITNDSSTTVTFNSFGRIVANADGSASITTLEVATPQGNRQLLITVQPGGSVKMCDPSALLPATDPRHC